MTIGRRQDWGALRPGATLCEVTPQHPGAAGANACRSMQRIDVLSVPCLLVLEPLLLLLLQLLSRLRRLPQRLSCLLRCIPHTINSSELVLRPGGALRRRIAVASIAVVQSGCCVEAAAGVGEGPKPGGLQDKAALPQRLQACHGLLLVTLAHGQVPQRSCQVAHVRGTLGCPRRPLQASCELQVRGAMDRPCKTFERKL